jgi:hypothetical protein
MVISTLSAGSNNVFPTSDWNIGLLPPSGQRFGLTRGWGIAGGRHLVVRVDTHHWAGCAYRRCMHGMYGPKSRAGEWMQRDNHGRERCCRYSRHSTHACGSCQPTISIWLSGKKHPYARHLTPTLVLQMWRSRQGTGGWWSLQRSRQGMLQVATTKGEWQDQLKKST